MRMHIDMCIDMCADMSVYGHAYGHVHRHVRKHVLFTACLHTCSIYGMSTHMFDLRHAYTHVLFTACLHRSAPTASGRAPTQRCSPSPHNIVMART